MKSNGKCPFCRKPKKTLHMQRVNVEAIAHITRLHEIVYDLVRSRCNLLDVESAELDRIGTTGKDAFLQ